jgi:hypothetical protein
LLLARAADADALRVVAAVAEGRGAAGADPLVAALVAFLLLFETLLERFHELVPAHLLDLGFFFGGELALQRFLEPVERHFLGEVGEHLHALEVGGEGAVELVVVLLVLDQRGAREIVEVVEAVRAVGVRPHHVGLQRLEQREVFLDRDRQLGRTQRVEEIDQHGGFPWASLQLRGLSSR